MTIDTILKVIKNIFVFKRSYSNCTSTPEDIVKTLIELNIDSLQVIPDATLVANLICYTLRRDGYLR